MNRTADPVQAPVHTTHSLAFFDDKGMVSTNYVPRGKTVNAKFLTKALHMFMNQKSPNMQEHDRY
jgi:hypothetical protein